MAKMAYVVDLTLSEDEDAGRPAQQPIKRRKLANRFVDADDSDVVLLDDDAEACEASRHRRSPVRRGLQDGANVLDQDEDLRVVGDVGAVSMTDEQCMVVGPVMLACKMQQRLVPWLLQTHTGCAT